MYRRIRKGIKKYWAELALMSGELLLLLVLFFTALLGFIIIARRIFFENKVEFDFKVLGWISGQVTDSATSLMKFLSFMGDHRFLIPANIALIIYFLFIKKHRWYSIKIPMVAISSVLIMSTLKLIFQRPRPLIPLLEAARGMSFPSGHAMTSVTFYGLLIYLVFHNFSNRIFRWSAAIFLTTLILGIGFSRIYLRVHYASDVIAGFCVGLIWLLLSLWLLKKIELFSKRKVDPSVIKEDPLTEAMLPEE